MNIPIISALIASITLAMLPPTVGAETVNVAVASNFTAAMQAISRRFESVTGHTIALIPGATGKHYAQIKNGAPFDIFFAADGARPRRLEDEGMAVAGSRFTYAVGKLVLWSPRTDYVDTEGHILERGDFRHVAIANPELAPYGEAAREVLEARNLWESLSRRLVRGENISQTLQFVQSGNAELGFVAYAQLKQPGREIGGSWWVVPRSLYSPIEQQAVLLTNSEAARAFVTFVQGDDARDIIRDFGYVTP